MSSLKCGCTGMRSCAACEPIRGVQRCPESMPLATRYAYCLQCGTVREGAPAATCGAQPCVPVFPDMADAGLASVQVLCGFVSPEEEAEMLQYADSRPWRPSQSGRNKQDFGPRVNFKKRTVNTSCFTGLPPFSKALLARIQAIPGLENFHPVEQCHLEYTAVCGSGIDTHIDDPWIWGDHLVTVNLLSDTVLSFQPPEDHPRGTDFEVCVLLPRYSLNIVKGAARYRWKHAIRREDVSARRIAVTLRELGPDFVAGGPQQSTGRELIDIAYTFAGEPVVAGPDGRS